MISSYNEGDTFFKARVIMLTDLESPLNHTKTRNISGNIEWGCTIELFSQDQSTKNAIHSIGTLRERQSNEEG